MVKSVKSGYEALDLTLSWSDRSNQVTPFGLVKSVSFWGIAMVFSTEQVPVSAYVGSSKNLKDLKDQFARELSRTSS